MESYSVTKRNQLLTQATQWMNFKDVILNEKKNSYTKQDVL